MASFFSDYGIEFCKVTGGHLTITAFEELQGNTHTEEGKTKRFFVFHPCADIYTTIPRFWGHLEMSLFFQLWQHIAKGFSNDKLAF